MMLQGLRKTVAGDKLGLLEQLIKKTQSSNICYSYIIESEYIVKEYGLGYINWTLLEKPWGRGRNSAFVSSLISWQICSQTLPPK
jgi:hypothetical protein